MTTRHQIEIEISSSLLLAMAFGIALAFSLGPKHNVRSVSLPAMQPIQNLQTVAFPTPTPSPVTIPPTVTSQLSPDGTKNLKMTITHNKDVTSTYSVVTTNADGSSPTQIYVTTEKENTLSIPFNTWSPDNNYVFLALTKSDGRSAIVMKADGTPVTISENTLDVGALFQAKKTADTYDETTGWASENLLIMNTKSANGTQGTSYWFEAPSKAIIPLANQF